MRLMHCPFCGSLDVEVEVTKAGMFSRGSVDFYEVACDTCSIVGPTSTNEDEAIALWNARPEAKVV
jgi:Lar family restriction alleviation protein